MGKVLKAAAIVVGVAATIASAGSLALFGTVAGVSVFGVGVGTLAAVAAGLSVISGLLLKPNVATSERQASETTISLGEHDRSAFFGEGGTAGGLLDAFNYGGKYNTDWEVLLIALADHECESLEGFYVNEDYVAFTGDGDVTGYSNQLKVAFLPGTETQAWPSWVTANGPGWSDTNANCAGVACVAVAYKADKPDAENPVWPGGRPRFVWVIKGKKCYDPRLDDTVTGGSGQHRWNDASTREWTDNAAICRYNYQRGIYALERVTQPDQLLLGRGLSETEAPPEQAIVNANICDEDVALAAGGTEKRYRVNGVIGAEEAFLQAEEKFANAMAGIITQPEGTIDVEPGHAKGVVAELIDDDLLNLEGCTFEKFRGQADEEWVNMVIPRYVEPEQRYKLHGAPVRRVNADLVADGGQRQKRLSLDLVTSGTQAQRCGEIARRLGRLTATGSIALGPRFTEIEEGDWIGWTSARHFDGARKIFRVESYNRSEKWHMRLALREISSTVFDWNPPTDELTDGAEANNQADRPAIGQPGESAWNLVSGEVAAPSGKQPALVVTGAIDDDYASAIKFEYRKASDTSWTEAGVSRRDAVRRVIAPIEPLTSYYVGVSYIVDGEPSVRRELGPLTSGNRTVVFDNITGSKKPADNATKSTEGSQFPEFADNSIGNNHVDEFGRRYKQLDSDGAQLLQDGEPITIDGVPIYHGWKRTDPVVKIGGVGGLTLQDSTGDNKVDSDLLNIYRREVIVTPEINLQADASGDLQSELPFTIEVKAKIGNDDVSASTSFAVEFPPAITGSVDNSSDDPSRGTITVDEVNGPGSLVITSTFEDGLKQVVSTKIAIENGQAPVTGGSGATMVEDRTWSNIDDDDYVQITDQPLILDSDGSGNLKFRFSSSFISDAGINIELIARYRVEGSTGAWSDAGTSQQGTPPQSEPEIGIVLPGFITKSEFVQDMGASSSSFEVALFGKRITGTALIIFDNSSSIFKVKQ